MRQIPGEGPKNCFIAFVGEAPGSHEDKIGRPFVGPAGQLFTELLTETGIIRTQCYITNVIKERPPNNDERVFINLEKKVPVISDRYVEYEQELQRELGECQANVIVAVGNIALYALTRKRSITKWRGSILESTLVSGRKVIPIIHPSAIFHEYLFRWYCLLDLRRIAHQSKYPDIRRPQRELRIEPTYEEAVRYMAEIIKESHIISYDIEVLNQELSCIAFAKSPTDVMCIPFQYKGDNYFSPEHESRVIDGINAILSNEGICKVAQNAIFDSTFLFKKYGIVARNQEDTMIAHQILAPDLPKGLDFMTSIYTEEPYYKDEGKMWKGITGSDSDFYIYNAKDAAVTLEIWHCVKRDLITFGNWDTYIRQKSLISPLAFMSERGIRIDQEGLKGQSEAAESLISRLEKQLQEIAEGYGYPDLNPRSPTQLKEYFYGREFRNIKAYVSRKTGAATTDEKALKRLSRRGYGEASILLDIRKWGKLKGTYFDTTLSEDGRIRCSFNPAGTESGRLSSSKTIFGEGTNLQNQPPEMKPFFLADDGYTLYNVDLSQAENRIVAYIAPEPRMITAFENKIDIHSLTASMMFGEEYEDIVRWDKEGKMCHIGRGTDSHRFWGKKSNHSFDYGLGYRAFAFYSEIEENEAKFIHDKWHGIYPGVKQYWAWVENQLRENHTMTNIFGRKRRYMGQWGHEMFKEAYSFIPQSSVADKINEHGISFIYNNQQAFPTLELLNQVHDSIVFQIPNSVGWEEHYTEVKAIVASLELPMRWRGQEFIIPAEVQAGFNLKDMKVLNVKNKDEFTKELERMWQGN